MREQRIFITLHKYLATLLLLFATASCGPTHGPDKSAAGTLAGATWGAGSGAIIGHQVNALGPGAAVGAGLGAAAGLMTGAGLDIQEHTLLETQVELDALKARVKENQQTLAQLQQKLDSRRQSLATTLTSERVFFDTDITSLRAGAAAQLQRFAEYIKQNPYLGHIEVHGYTDIGRDAESENKTSEERARAVAACLISNGISADQISVVPHGSKEPLASNSSEAGRQLNRRVDIILLK